MIKKHQIKLMSFLVLLSLLIGSVLFAHSGVKDINVLNRMKLMSSMAEHVKVLSQMMTKKISFNAEKASETLNKIFRLSENTRSVFMVNAIDPKSEAKPIIWKEFDNFIKLSNKLSDSTKSLSISTYEDLRPAIIKIGADCKACHKKYRE